MPFVFRGEQRRAMQKAAKICSKLAAWDFNIPNLSPRSRLSRTKMLPTTPLPSVSQFATALQLLLTAQLAKQGTWRNVPNH